MKKNTPKIFIPQTLKSAQYPVHKKNGSYHSSDLGRYLGACVHYSTLFGKPCLGNSYLNGLSNENATNIQMVADAAISEANWNYNEDTNCELSFWC